MVNVTKKKMKEEIIKQSYQNSEVNGKQILIMKELPKQILMDRKAFRKLTDKLKVNNVKFQWEMPIGVSFSFKGERKTIKTEEQMRKFLRENEDFAK